MAEDKKEKNKSFVLRVDADMMEAIEKWAADEFRSVNGQLQWIISDALRRNGRTRRKTKSSTEGDNNNQQ
ncbi:MAG: Arc family DNA-binding protein [Flavobacteriales bacterium]|nr:Arc family DNA-binding protein [Flavobacteriales bacterium]